MEKAKHNFIGIALVLAFIMLLESAGRLLAHNIPTLFRGYEEVALEYEDEEYYDYMGISKTKQKVTQSYQRPVSVLEAVFMILESAAICILSLGVWILNHDLSKE